MRVVRALADHWPLAGVLTRMIQSLSMHHPLSAGNIHSTADSALTDNIYTPLLVHRCISVLLPTRHVRNIGGVFSKGDGNVPLSRVPQESSNHFMLLLRSRSGCRAESCRASGKPT